MRSSSVIAILLFAIFTLSPRAALAQPGSGTMEAGLFASANRARADRGLPPLRWSPLLAAAARQHALRMARENALSHQFPGEPGLKERIAQHGGRFVSIAENIAQGPSAAAIHEEWMNSPPHRANLLDPQLDSLGAAVVAGNGTLFAVEDFSLAGEMLSFAEQELEVGAQLHARGLRLMDFLADARKSCILDNGFAGRHTPSFVLHYATTSLQTLPDMLEKRLATGQYQAAAVGACPVGKNGLSGYRLAVMLYK